MFIIIIPEETAGWLLEVSLAFRQSKGFSRSVLYKLAYCMYIEKTNKQKNRNVQDNSAIQQLNVQQSSLAMSVEFKETTS